MQAFASSTSLGEMSRHSTNNSSSNNTSYNAPRNNKRFNNQQQQGPGFRPQQTGFNHQQRSFDAAYNNGAAGQQMRLHHMQSFDGSIPARSAPPNFHQPPNAYVPQQQPMPQAVPCENMGFSYQFAQQHLSVQQQQQAAIAQVQAYAAAAAPQQRFMPAPGLPAGIATMRQQMHHPQSTFTMQQNAQMIPPHMQMQRQPLLQFAAYSQQQQISQRYPLPYQQQQSLQMNPTVTQQEQIQQQQKQHNGARSQGRIMLVPPAPQDPSTMPQGHAAPSCVMSGPMQQPPPLMGVAVSQFAPQANLPQYPPHVMPESHNNPSVSSSSSTVTPVPQQQRQQTPSDPPPTQQDSSSPPQSITAAPVNRGRIESGNRSSTSNRSSYKSDGGGTSGDNSQFHTPNESRLPTPLGSGDDLNRHADNSAPASSNDARDSITRKTSPTDVSARITSDSTKSSENIDADKTITCEDFLKTPIASKMTTKVTTTPENSTDATKMKETPPPEEPKPAAKSAATRTSNDVRVLQGARFGHGTQYTPKKFLKSKLSDPVATGNLCSSKTPPILSNHTLLKEQKQSAWRYCTYCVEMEYADHDTHILTKNGVVQCDRLVVEYTCATCNEVGHIEPRCPKNVLLSTFIAFMRKNDIHPSLRNPPTPPPEAPPHKQTIRPPSVAGTTITETNNNTISGRRSTDSQREYQRKRSDSNMTTSSRAESFKRFEHHDSGHRASSRRSDFSDDFRGGGCFRGRGGYQYDRFQNRGGSFRGRGGNSALNYSSSSYHSFERDHRYDRFDRQSSYPGHASSSNHSFNSGRGSVRGSTRGSASFSTSSVISTRQSADHANATLPRAALRGIGRGTPVHESKSSNNGTSHSATAPWECENWRAQMKPPAAIAIAARSAAAVKPQEDATSLEGDNPPPVRILKRETAAQPKYELQETPVTVIKSSNSQLTYERKEQPTSTRPFHQDRDKQYYNSYRGSSRGRGGYSDYKPYPPASGRGSHHQPSSARKFDNYSTRRESTDARHGSTEEKTQKSLSASAQDHIAEPAVLANASQTLRAPQPTNDDSRAKKADVKSAEHKKQPELKKTTPSETKKEVDSKRPEEAKSTQAKTASESTSSVPEHKMVTDTKHLSDARSIAPSVPPFDKRSTPDSIWANRGFDRSSSLRGGKSGGGSRSCTENDSRLSAWKDKPLTLVPYGKFLSKFLRGQRETTIDKRGRHGGGRQTHTDN